MGHNNNKRFYSKTHAFQQAVKVWACKACGTWHKKKKPHHCEHCGFNDFLYFASTFEAKRYAELSLLEKTGQIVNLRTQVAYPITVNGVHICKYIADFQYNNANTGELIVEDTKGHEKAVTSEFKLKRKLVGALHGIDVKAVYQHQPAKQRHNTNQPTQRRL